MKELEKDGTERNKIGKSEIGTGRIGEKWFDGYSKLWHMTAFLNIECKKYKILKQNCDY